ncbi:MAG TPA: hypothetical protein VGJ73_02775 [Verrucomicrobiae bacterium]|jgi:hypothetical protein
MKILLFITLAAFPVMCWATGGAAPAGAPATAAPTPLASQQNPTPTPAPGTPSNNPQNTTNPNLPGGVNGVNGINGAGNAGSSVNGGGNGVYQNGFYYRNGTYGYNTNLGTSGYANTNSLPWTTNPPEPGYERQQVPGNALPTPINLPANSAVAQPPGVNLQHPTNAPPPP